MTTRISERQRRFAAAYLATGDARRAAEAAGCDRRRGSVLLKQAGVRACLAEAARAAPQPVADAQEVLEYLTGVLRGEAEPEGRSGASSPRMKAAELLGKRLGVFNETAEECRAPVIIDDICAASGGGEPNAGSDAAGGG